jgi:hypothetical protein
MINRRLAPRSELAIHYEPALHESGKGVTICYHASAAHAVHAVYFEKLCCCRNENSVIYCFAPACVYILANKVEKCLFGDKFGFD